MVYHLGKKPPRKGAIKLSFASYFDKTKLPAVPALFGRVGIGRPWLMLGNDGCGDCVLAGAAHETMLWSHLAGYDVSFNDQSVLADYSALTGYDPKNSNTDQGTDMQEAASYRRRIGIVDTKGSRHKIEAYVALHPGNLDQVAAAAYLLGAVGIGLRLPADADVQFDNEQPWTKTTAKVAGGHYVPLIGRNSAGNFLIVTWGRIHAVTPPFLEEYMDEGVAYLSTEMLRDNLSPRGFDVATLRADLAALAA